MKPEKTHNAPSTFLFVSLLIQLSNTNVWSLPTFRIVDSASMLSTPRTLEDRNKANNRKRPTIKKDRGNKVSVPHRESPTHARCESNQQANKGPFENTGIGKLGFHGSVPLKPDNQHRHQPRMRFIRPKI